MINNKKALSTVVTTLIIILLVLVAIGIIWAVISNVITEGSETINYSVKCLEVDVKATNVVCADGDNCNVTLSRGSQGDVIEGVKLVFSNPTDGASGVLEFGAPVDTLQTVTRTISGIGLVTVAESIEVTSYFVDNAGNQKFCTTYTYSF